VGADAALHLLSSRTEIPFFKAMACCLQYSTQVPHPLQSSGMRSGRILPMTPVSFRSGLLHIGAAGYGDAEPYREFPLEDPPSPSQSLDGTGFTERFYLVLRKQALVMSVVPICSPGYRSRFRTMLQRSQR
jgi:hypothetical protein